MAKGPRLDLRRLERDTAVDTRATKLAPGGKPITGLMALVRENLDALVALQAGGRTWGAIAAGLTAQGFRTADGRDLTASNLTGVISSVRRQAVRDLSRKAARRSRSDAVVDAPEPITGLVGSADTSKPVRPRLSPDLTAAPTATGRSPASEEERRRAALARAQSLLKKD